METGLEQKENRNTHRIQERENNIALIVDNGISERRDMKSFLASIGADFLLGNNIKGNDSEKFFQNLLSQENADAIILKIISHIIERYKILIIGFENDEEYLEPELFQNILNNLLTGVIEFDVKFYSNYFDQILKYYTATCLDSNQQLLFTDSIINTLENKFDNINMASKTRLLIDIDAIRENSTRLHIVYEDDFEKIENILSGQCDLKTFIRENERELKSETGLNIRFIKYAYNLIIENLQNGSHLSGVKFLYDYINKQKKSDKYFVRIYANMIFDFLNSAISSVEEQMWLDIIDFNNDDELVFRERFENEDGEDVTYQIYKNWDTFDIQKRIEYYQIMRKHIPQLTDQEISGVQEYLMENLYSNSSENKRVDWSDDLNNFPVAKGVVGKYSKFGDLLGVEVLGNNGIMAIDTNEQLVEYFLERTKLHNKKEFPEKAIEIFEENYLFFIFSNLNTRAFIEKRFNINLGEVDVFVQKQFFNFLKNAKDVDIEKVARFFSGSQSARKANRLKAFLSLEQDREMGEKILLIGERLGVEEADLIFGQYAKIVDMTENVKEELKKILKRQKIDVEEIDEQVFKNITESVLLKAGELLINFADRLERGEEMDSKKILEELKNFNEDLLFTFGTFKNLKGQLRLEDLEDTEFERVSVERYNDLKEEIIAIRNGSYTLEEIEKIEDKDKREKLKEIYEMFELYRKNYKDRPGFLEILLDGFVEVLTKNETNTHLYFVKQHGRIIGFNRYDLVGKNKKIMGSCNVMPSVQALSVGGAMFVESLDNEKEGYDLELATDAFSPVSLMYMKQGKFQVEKITDEFDPDKKWSFVMKRIKDRERNNFYEGKDLVKEYKKQNTENNQQEAVNRFVVRLPKDSVQNNEYIRELVNERGFKITKGKV